MFSDLRPLFLIVLLGACSSSAPTTPGECRAACDDLVARCGASHDCESLCRDVRLEGDADALACLGMHGPPFVSCASGVGDDCASTCDDEASSLAACNTALCAMVPELPGCTAEPLVTECSAESTDLPSYDRRCADDSHCALFFHQVDCCGTTQAAAYAWRVGDQVLDAEEACRAMIPACDCPVGPLLDENGDEVGPGVRVSAVCSEGTCRALRE